MTRKELKTKNLTTVLVLLNNLQKFGNAPGHLYLVTPSYHLTMIPCLSAHTDCFIVCA